LKLKLTTVTPVHIRGEGELDDLNSLINSEIVKFDLDGYLDHNPDELDAFLEYVESSGGFARLSEFIDEKGAGVSDHIIYKVRVDDYTLKHLRNLIKDGRPVSIPEHIKTGGSYAYIPGSSIKGSIRTALAHLALKENPELWDEIIGSRRGKGRNERLGKKLENAVFRCKRDGKYFLDLMSLIQVSDTDALRPEYSLMVGSVRIVKVQKGSWDIPPKLREPLTMELLEQNRELNFEIRVDGGRIRQLWNEGDPHGNIRKKIEALFGIIPEEMNDREIEEKVIMRIFTALRSRSNALLQKIKFRYSQLPSDMRLHKLCLAPLKQDFKSRLKYYCNNCKKPGISMDESIDIKSILELIEKYIKELSNIAQSPDKVLMRLGWGSGFHAMTLLAEMPEIYIERINFKKLKNKTRWNIYPKTVRLYLERGRPAGELGWVTIEVPEKK